MASEERSGLKVLVVGEDTLVAPTVFRLRNDGLGVQTVSVDRFKLASSTYGPDVIVCSERSLDGDLDALLRATSRRALVVLKATSERTARTFDLPGPLVVVPGGTSPAETARLVRKAAQRIRTESEGGSPSAPTLPSSRSASAMPAPPRRDLSARFSLPPAAETPPPSPAPDEEPTALYPMRDFMRDDLRLPHGSASRNRDESITPSTPPTSVRMPLSQRGRYLDGVRIALADTDPTRTDALAVALRIRRAEVHIASLHGDRGHFRLLRRFAPHALLIDEQVLAEQGRDFLRQFREDPFLQHTQLLTLRFDRLFRVRSGTASIESIKDILEPLGRAEAELLAQLGPDVEVEFDLDQYPPHRLIKMLAGRTSPTTISCTRGKETFRWTVANGKTGRAELRHRSYPEPCHLSPEEALDWLLSHQNCHVVLHEPNDFDDTTGRDVIPLVEDKESGLWEKPMWLPKSRSVGGSRSSESNPDSLPAFSLFAEASRRGRFLSSSWEGTRSHKAWLILLAVGLVAAGVVTMTSVDSSDQRPTGATERTSIARPAAEAASDIPVSTSTAPSRSNGAAEIPTKDSPPKAARTAVDEEDVPSKAGAERKKLFAVPVHDEIPCETMVGEWTVPERAPKGLAMLHFRTAQRLVVDGRTDQAHLELCKSALSDPSGPGAEFLAQFALAQRAPGQAERWIRAVLQADEKKTPALELLGDILHQQGRLDEALETWLSALSMSPDEREKRAAVARVWIGHARTSLAAADYPRAERNLRRALSFDEKNAEAAGLLALVFHRRKHRELAKSWEHEAARLKGAH